MHTCRRQYRGKQSQIKKAGRNTFNSNSLDPLGAPFKICLLTIRNCQNICGGGIPTGERHVFPYKGPIFLE